jgi:hypothetical protein
MRNSSEKQRIGIFGIKHSSNVDLPNNAKKLTVYNMGHSQNTFDTCFTIERLNSTANF